MARRIFFSFHYQRDIFRVNVVRNSDVTKKNVEESGYWDHSLWEETQRKGDAALQALIADGLRNTSVTVLLTGTETSERRWVRYEAVKSFERGNGFIALYIHDIEDPKKGKDTKGVDPLSRLYFSTNDAGNTASVLQQVNGDWKTYMTINTSFIPPAAKRAGKGFLSQFARSYNWVSDSGYANFARWIETAATDAGK